ncbi:MAG: MotA/TolQ/ExbB proton channel family protein [Puniceicoccales bacterium]|jgi:biopolymer transport protein ExbB|nr:MotA/TolQ/ExbB proton channel family protein [Puniceicoccales bacterium]
MPVASNLESLSIVSAAGPLAWPLLLLGLIGLVFFVERTLFLHSGQIRAGEFLAGIKNNLREGRLNEALTHCNGAPGPVPRVIKAVLHRAGEGEQRMRLAAEEAALLEVPALERRVGTLLAIAKIAPLLGLTGTVFALLRAFLDMRSQGHYATADAFASDIAAALAVTALGLVVAALAHLAHHFLAARVRAILHDIEWAAHGVLAFVCTEMPAMPAAPAKTDGLPVAGGSEGAAARG